MLWPFRTGTDTRDYATEPNSGQASFYRMQHQG